MKRGLLIIDRGSREPEAGRELEEIARRVRERGGYHYCDYCFLEVIPPFIREGIDRSLESGIEGLTIVPYFLYPGKKVKAAVAGAMRMQSGAGAKFLVTRPMSKHQTMVSLARSRISAALDEGGVSLPDGEVDVMIIGHGSVDPNAKMAIEYVADGLRPGYRNVSYCFLENEEPDIPQGVAECRGNGPDVLVIVFYFLHKGAHVKRDIYEELNPALEGGGLGRILITKHIGADPMMIDLILERAAEVEDAD